MVCECAVRAWKGTRHTCTIALVKMAVAVHAILQEQTNEMNTTNSSSYEAGQAKGRLCAGDSLFKRFSELQEKERKWE